MRLMFQYVVLFSGTVLHNIRIGRPDATREQAVDAARRAQAHAFIERLPQGYDTVIDEGGASPSGGERQRLSIALALLKDAPILLLDEATASIDPSAEAEIQLALSELVRERAVVVIAYRLRSVRHADHILVLHKGRLAEPGGTTSCWSIPASMPDFGPTRNAPRVGEFSAPYEGGESAATYRP
ncbi:ATP-binding cassette domain-containing protein [Variovorax sp. GB1P17]|uniref:ATP-binding cassette domain-containing protein n=1 Tax=Variovorax sp. GB1P17 TaxID=3443740 RepID=UPI003F4900A2